MVSQNRAFSCRKGEHMEEFIKEKNFTFWVYKLSVLITIALTLAISAFSQSSEKCFRGTVKDANEAFITGAEVVLKDVNGKTLERTESDQNGEFRLGCYPNAAYSLIITKRGMAVAEKTVELSGKNVSVSDVVLNVAEVAEVVQVEIEPVFITSETQAVTKTFTPLRDLPQSVEIVNRQLIDSQAVRSMQDALSNVTAVSTAQGEGRRDQFFIRGFSAIGDQFVDGVRDDALYYRDLANIEQIEVVKGPSAALFGRGSSGGIINRVTKKPNLFDKVGSIEGIFGTYGLKRANFDFGMPIISEKLAFRFIGAVEETGSFRHYFKENRLNIAPSLAWQPDAKTDIKFQFEFLDDTRTPDRGIPSFRGRPVKVPIGTYYGNPNEDEINNKVNSQAVIFEREITKFWKFRNNFRRIEYDTEYYNTFSNGICLQQLSGTCSTNIPSAILIDDPRLRVVRGQYSGEFRQENYFNQSEFVGVVETAGIVHTLLAGVEYGVQDKRTVRSNNASPVPVALTNPDLNVRVADAPLRTLTAFSGKTVGLYVQDQIAFNNHWKALIGIRFDNFKQELDDLLPANNDLGRTDKQWSPRAGLVYQPNEWLSFYGSFSRSFQPSGENLSLAASNEELGPESTKNYEAGIKATFVPLKLNANFAIFHLRRDNIKSNDPLNPGQLILIGEQRTNGLEINFSGSPLDKFDFVAGYALLDARITRSTSFSGGVPLEGRFAQLTPRNSGNFWMTYRLPSGFRIGFGGNARSKTFTSTNNLVTLPGYAKFDGSLSWQSEKHYEIAFNLKNIFNRKYFETAHNDNQIMPGSPINGSVTLRYKW